MCCFVYTMWERAQPTLFIFFSKCDWLFLESFFCAVIGRGQDKERLGLEVKELGRETRRNTS